MSALIKSILGPRVSRSELAARPSRFIIPTALLLIAAVLLVISFFQPYWHMTLHAPQYPGGLHVHAYLNQLEGDVAEIDGLNHYIGMRPLDDAAQLEKSLSFMTVIVFGLLVAAAIFIHSKWAALATLPALLFPVGFLVDLQLWLRNFGQNLDPTAALSSSVDPFTPPVLGSGFVGQFKTVAIPGAGMWIAIGASVIILIGLFFHRRAYRPLHLEAQRRGAEPAEREAPVAEATVERRSA